MEQINNHQTQTGEIISGLLSYGINPEPLPPDVAQPVYIGYWHNAPENFHNGSKDAHRKCRKNLNRSRNRRSKLLANYDVHPRKVDSFRSVEKWYRNLGSLNSLQGGRDDLLCGFELLDVERRLEQPDRETEAILLAGCLVHEAALVTEESGHKDELLSLADKVYGVIADPTSFAGNREDMQEAHFYRHDVKFDRLFDRAQDPSVSTESLARSFQELQTRYIDDFLLNSRLWRKHEGNQIIQDAVIGSLFERFCALVYRHHTWNNRAFDQVNARLTFPREDRPHDKLKFKEYGSRPLPALPLHSIDLVLVHYQDSVEVDRTWIQAKVGNNIRENDYIDEIVPVVADFEDHEQLLDLMQNVARSIRRSYQPEPLSVVEKHKIQEGVDLVDAELLGV